MSNTKKTHERFWATMGERFGKRWIDDYGSIPTLAWRELLDRYSPQEIKAALELMHSRGLEHPPTEPQFAEMLVTAQKRSVAAGAELNAADYRRGYWRAAIITLVAKELGYDFATFEPVLVANRHTLGEAMKRLLDDVDELESTTGQRTAGMELMVEKRCMEICAAFRQLRKAA
jgi:hypothetical protein